MNIVKNPAAAEEITQNTFVKAMTTKSEYEGSSSPYTWLCAIAKNQCYDYFRKNGRIAEAVEPEQEAVCASDVTEDFVVRETSLSIHRILHDMEEPYKEVFNLRVFGELSYEKIGTLFQKSSGWVRVTFYRAKKKIEEYMEEQGYE
jgi:RNA polymerase sigma-70 factor (ECF subfamily)